MVIVSGVETKNYYVTNVFARKYINNYNKVWYCTENCRERDLTFHENKCKKRFEIEDSNLKLSSESKRGIVGIFKIN